MRKSIIILLSALILTAFVGCESDSLKENTTTSKSSESSSKSIESSVTSKSESTSTKSNEEGNKESKEESEEESEENSSDKLSGDDIKFDNSYAFLGNSLIGDLYDYDVIDDADSYSYVGLNVASIFDQKIEGHKKTILDEMFSKNYKTIFILLGTNELGWSYSDIFVDDYKELIDMIKEKFPDAEINLISITPITKSQEEKNEDGLNSKNIEKYNELIQQIAKEKNVTYLDVNSYLRNKEGYLSEDDSPDGYHLEPNCSLKFVKIIKHLISQ